MCKRKFGPVFDSISFSCQKKKITEKISSIHIIQKFLDHLVYLFLSLILPTQIHTASLCIFLISILSVKRSGFDVPKKSHRLHSITKYTPISACIPNKNRLHKSSRGSISRSSGRGGGG